MAGNQTQVPVIQSDQNTTQLQQNTNKGLRNLNNQLVSLQDEMNQTVIIGEVKFASLSLSQFQAVAGNNWILANGQSAVDTEYARLTGNTTVPTVTLAGVNTFIRVD